MIKGLLFVLLGLLFTASCINEPKELNWSDLVVKELEWKWNDLYQDSIEHPVFSNEQILLNKKPISITGTLLQLDTALFLVNPKDADLPLKYLPQDQVISVNAKASYRPKLEKELNKEVNLVGIFLVNLNNDLDRFTYTMQEVVMNPDP